MKKWKRLGAAILAVCMMAVSQVSMALAAETTEGVVDFGLGDASITIQGNDGQSLKGKTWILHKLFDAEDAAGGESIQYMINDVYKTSLQTVVGTKLSKTAAEVTEYEILDYMESMNTGGGTTLEGAYSDYRYFIENVIAQIHADNVEGESITVSSVTASNSVELKGLAYGYYIVEDATAISGENGAASLAIVTTSNDEADINVKSDYPTVTKKIYEDDNNIGWNDIADYEIGESVPFQYTSNIPDINGYDRYYYAWHDVMDEALTFQTDSICIKISGSYNGAAKEYTLNSTEYTLVTEPENDDTFQIQISDIKSIVDREFSDLGEKEDKEYGQTVTVTYKATLNDAAADDTGRPGFENDVRLEFSNNPNLVDGVQSDSTGFTPWDTVVCFTYRLDGLKVNNTPKALADAKFKIYRDEACTEEVFSQEYVSDENGKFVIYGLDSGTYYLKETEAPAGYRPIDEPIVITVTATFPEDRNSYQKGDGALAECLTLEGNATITTFAEGKEVVDESALVSDAETGSLAITVVNQIGNILPVTGSSAMLLLSVLGISLILIGLKTGKKQHE